MPYSTIAAISSSLTIHPNNLMEDFLQHFTVDFHQLLSRCISMILDGSDCYELGRSMLLNYIKNIKRINGLNRASTYSVHLQDLDQDIIILNNLRQVGVVAIAEIEVACVHTKFHLLEEELKKEEACIHEVQELTNARSRIDNELERAKLKMETTQSNISWAWDTTAISQVVLQAKELKFSEIMRCHEELKHQ